jgi:hypothetical protein
MEGNGNSALTAAAPYGGTLRAATVPGAELRGADFPFDAVDAFADGGFPYDDDPDAVYAGMTFLRRTAFPEALFADRCVRRRTLFADGPVRRRAVRSTAATPLSTLMGAVPRTSADRLLADRIAVRLVPF